MFIKPDDVTSMLDAREGMQVADFGAGSGTHALLLARRVGTSGAVYAFDIRQEALERLAHDAEHRRLSNVHAITADVEHVGGTTLADASVDRVLVANVLFQAEDKASLAREASRIVKPGGKVLVIEWTDGVVLGTHDRTLIPQEVLVAHFARAGLRPVVHDGVEKQKDVHDSVHQYAMLLEKEEKKDEHHV